MEEFGTYPCFFAPMSVSTDAPVKRNAKWRTLLRLVLSVLALWLVSRRIDFAAVGQLLLALKWPWLLPAVVLFVLSHVASSERSRWLWRAAGADLQPAYTWRLYWLGLFYSLFLPGGVGGDGYKVYHLNRHTPAKLPALIKAGLLDRGYGVALILWLSGALALFIPGLEPLWRRWLLLVLLAYFPLLWLFLRVVFPSFQPVFFPALGYSLVKQVLQAAAAVGLLFALGTPFHPAYPLAFLLSSLALLLPISIGGMGARELVLSYLPADFPIQEEAAVAMSLLFFVLSALFALTGSTARDLPVQFREGRAEDKE